jgi:hypothetical protein
MRPHATPPASGETAPCIFYPIHPNENDSLLSCVRCIVSPLSSRLGRIGISAIAVVQPLPTRDCHHNDINEDDAGSNDIPATSPRNVLRGGDRRRRVARRESPPRRRRLLSQQEALHPPGQADAAAAAAAPAVSIARTTTGHHPGGLVFVGASAGHCFRDNVPDERWRAMRISRWGIN